MNIKNTASGVSDDPGCCVVERHIYMAKVIMVQGTMSNAGKSFLAAGLLRIMKQDGYRAAPFKSQNMALNSFITDEGLEMGRAQVMQAEAAGIKPMVCMNPILLKPVNNTGSQVIVNGEVMGNMSARDYFKFKKQLVPEIKAAFKKLEEYADIIVIEGAGSPAEINLRNDDIVNMGMAELVDAPVLLAGDIDRGGVFAQLAGTMMLLKDDEKARVKGLLINKFRGDKTILDPGVVMLEDICRVPVVGVIPMMDVKLEDEDSLTERFSNNNIGQIDIAVIRYPRISNFTDLNTFEQMENVSVRYITGVSQLGRPDMIVLPGSKNTMGDLNWMRQNGLEASVIKRSHDIPVFGICGGFQMLGKSISDPYETEESGTIRGMGLLNVNTVMQKEKVRSRCTGCINDLDGVMSSLSGLEYEGYEIHMGETSAGDEKTSDIIFTNGENVYGTYVHGIFDRGNICRAVIKVLAERKGISPDPDGPVDYADYKEKQYDRLAEILREHLDMDAVYSMLKESKI